MVRGLGQSVCLCVCLSVYSSKILKLYGRDPMLGFDAEVRKENGNGYVIRGSSIRGKSE